MSEQFALATSVPSVGHWCDIVRQSIQPRPGGIPADLASPQLPGSKSHAQRALLLASFLPGRTQLSGVPDNQDLAVLRAVMMARGVTIAATGSQLVVRGVAPRPGESVAVDAGENATAARMLLAMVPLLGSEVLVDGHERLRRRPMTAAVAMLRAAGVEVVGDALPIRADGRALQPRPEVVAVDASAITQPASGAMLAVALAGGGVVEVRSPADVGYLDLTAQMLALFGARVLRHQSATGIRFSLTAPLADDREVRVPVDPSARAFVVVLAALHGLSLPPGLAGPVGDAHPDWQIDRDVADLAVGEADVSLAGLRQRPDCVPALAALAAHRSGRTTFSGLANLRTKESDRLLALVTALRALGVEASVAGDDLTVCGPLPAHRARVSVPAVADHRIVMAMALLGTVLPHGIEIDHAEAVHKSWPGFWDWLGRCALLS